MRSLLVTNFKTLIGIESHIFGTVVFFLFFNKMKIKLNVINNAVCCKCFPFLFGFFFFFLELKNGNFYKAIYRFGEDTMYEFLIITFLFSYFLFHEILSHIYNISYLSFLSFLFFFFFVIDTYKCKTVLNLINIRFKNYKNA